MGSVIVEIMTSVLMPVGVMSTRQKEIVGNEMYQFKLPYSKFARFIIDVDHLLEKSKKYIYGWLPCYNCEHKLYDHVSYDHLSDPKGVCIKWNPNNDYSFNCGCEEYNFWNYLRYLLGNYRQDNSSGNEKK